MPITINVLRAPEPYSPTYNPSHWLLDCSYKNRSGFQYLVEYSTGTSFSVNPPMVVPKRPNNGFGLLDLSSILRSEIDHEKDIIAGSSGFVPAPNYGRSYTLRLGMQSDFFSFDDSYFDVSSNVMFSSASDVHDFVIGDKAIIEQTNPTFSQFDGVHTVIDVIDEHAFVIDVPFASGPVTPGKAYRQDGQAITHTGITITSGVTFGAALDRTSFVSFTADQFITDASSAGEVKLLTHCPNTFRVRPDHQAWIPVPNNTFADVMRVITINDFSETVGVYEINNSLVSNGDPFAYAGIGPHNISNATYSTITGPTEIFNSSAVSYYIGFLSASSTNQTTVNLKLDLDHRCQPHQVFRLLFCDNLGGWTPFDFPFKSDDELTIKKQTFLKGGFGTIQGNGVNYSNQARGFDPYSTDLVRSITVRSDTLTQVEADHLVRLLTSPRAFWCVDETTFVPIIIDDGSVVKLVEDQEDDLLRFEVTFTPAYKEASIG